MSDNYGKFNDICKAKRILTALRNIAIEYGHATVCDLKVLLNYGTSFYDTRIGWASDELEEAFIEQYNYAWRIVFPVEAHEIIPDANTEYDNSTTISSNSDILAITIHTKELENPAETLADIFKHIPEIKERMINITIM